MGISSGLIAMVMPRPSGLSYRHVTFTHIPLSSRSDEKNVDGRTSNPVFRSSPEGDDIKPDSMPVRLSRSRGFESCQIWPQARTVGSEGVNGSEYRFPYHEFLGPPPGRNRGGIYDFVQRARSPDTELGLSICPNQQNESAEPGDDSQPVT